MNSSEGSREGAECLKTGYHIEPDNETLITCDTWLNVACVASVCPSFLDEPREETLATQARLNVTLSDDGLLVKQHALF